MDSLDTKKQRRRIARCFFMICVVAGVTAVFTNADAANATWSGTTGVGSLANQSWDMTEFKNKVWAIYKIADTIACAVAAVAFAVNLLEAITGTMQEAEAAKQRIKYVLIALILIQLIPLFIEFGVTIGHKYEWTPSIATQ